MLSYSDQIPWQVVHPTSQSVSKQLNNRMTPLREVKWDKEVKFDCVKHMKVQSIGLATTSTITTTSLPVCFAL